MDDFTDFGTDYGQREPLTRRIRTLLKDYPDGLPVPKELIQNADDAQASECCLLLDLRQHTTEKLINAKIKGFQGPALVFWNNQTFSPADFQNLCEFGGETKLEDRKKVGKFGLGFNSVYNLTDLPQFVSGEHYCVLDPHEKYFNGKRGKMFKLGDTIPGLEQSVAHKIQGQLQPFDGLFEFFIDNAATGQNYVGTIFRFPLRTADNALVSDICKNSYTKEEALSLIQMTNENANLFLLFVQFVNKFQISIWKDDEPQLSTLSEFNRTFSQGNPRDSQVLFGGSDKFFRFYQICIMDQTQNEETLWDIHVSAPGIKSSDGTRAIGAIAYPSVDLNLESNKLLFCFLPLPMPPDTGLPFLVNATFAVTSSRRYLEFSTMDDKSRSAKSADGEWNRTLVEQAVVPALCEAVLRKSRSHGQEKLFNLFPSLAHTPEPLMKQLITSFYQRLVESTDMKVFLNKARNTYHALVENNTVLFSDSIPQHIQDVLIECAEVMPNSCTWLQVPEKVLATMKQLQPNLCLQKTKTIDYFVKCLMPQMRQILSHGTSYVQSVYKVFLYALEKSNSSQSIVKTLRSNQWIILKSATNLRSYNLTLKRPDELVRPDGTAASFLKFTDDFFPSEMIPFEPKHFQILCQTSFGMFSDYLPMDAIKAIVGNLNNPPLDVPEYRERFTLFVTHLNNQHLFYRNQEIEKHLCELKILADTPKIVLKRSEEVYQHEMYNLVSYQFSTCNFTKLGLYESSFCGQLLRLYKTPSMNVLLNNLKAGISKPDKSFSEKCQTVVHTLSFIQTKHNNSRHMFFNEAQRYNLIPTNKEPVFCNLTQVCLSQNCPVLDGHLYSVNTTVSNNWGAKQLLLFGSVQESFSLDVYERIINSLAKITDEQVVEVRSILEHLKKNGFKKKLKFPGNDGIMYETEYLCLNDFELNERSSASIDCQLKYCHRTIPHNLALHFGVQTKRQMILEKNSTPLFKEFRQSESLCNRLSRITQSYSNDMDVFKELIQNADDAGASQIHFILDLRNLSKNYVFDKQWERLLEPALLVFNDSYFTSGDIEGIQKLGEGSKRNAGSKIGKFGVGFNCVYKLTDCPTFLTQVDGSGSGNLCLLDPCCFIKNEGCMLEATPELQEIFPDSFSCFFVGDENMNALEGKTMLRLPLRKTKSALSATVPTIEDLKTNLKKLASRSETFVLFLQNITSLKVSTIDDSGIETFSTCEKTVFDSTYSLSSFRNQVSNNQYYMQNIEHKSVATALYEVVVEKDLNGEKSSRKWLVSEQVGSLVSADTNLAHWHRQNDSPPRRHGAVALPLESGYSKEKCKFFCYLPIEETTRAVQTESIELPVHVNGQFFLGESRRVIELNKSEFKGLWNAYVLRNIVGPAYANLIEHFITQLDDEEIPFEIQKYLSLFPPLKAGHSKISEDAITYFIARGLFDNLRKTRFVPSLEMNNALALKSFSDVQNVHNVFTLNASMASETNSLNKLTSLFMRLAIPLTTIPTKHFQLWRQCQVVLEDLEASFVLQNLKQIIQPPVSIQETPLQNKSTLLCLINWARDSIVLAPDKNSLPIYLSAGGTLYHNTSENKLYSNDTNLLKIFPQLADQLLDLEVELKLRELNIPCKMSLNEFVSNFKEFFPDLCEGEIIEVEEVNEQFPQLKDLEKWVCHIWDFFVRNQEALQNFLNEIDQFSILLCQNRNKKLHFVPISEGKTCVFPKLDILSIGTVKVNLSSFDCFYEMVPVLFNQTTKGARSFLISELILNNRNNPSHFLAILRIIHENHGCKYFSTASRDQLKEYFYTSYENGDLQCDAEDLEILRSLPIHLTMGGNYGSLCGPQSVYSIPRDMPLDGMECSDTLADKFVVQENSAKKQELQKYLGVISKTSPQLYVEFIIPLVFPKGDESVIVTHLKFLAKKFESNWSASDQNAVIASLQDVEFLENMVDEKKRLKSLYDQENALYRTFLDKTWLLNSKYDQGSILNWLKRCGLKHEVTKTELWHFVDLLASELIKRDGRIDDEDFERVALILCEFEKRAYGQSDYQKLQALHLFETENMGVKPLKECFDSSFLFVVSEVAPVLSERFASLMIVETHSRTPKYANTRLRQHWIAERGNNFEPSTELVFQNLKALCTSHEKSSHNILECLKYLCDKENSVSPQIIQELRKLPCIQVGDSDDFVSPRSICKVVKCPCEKIRKREISCAEINAYKCSIMSEYVNRASEKYLQLWSLLERCGATETINFQQVIYALETFKEEFQGDIQYNPNMFVTKYANLEYHFYSFLANCDSEEIAQVIVKQPIYLRTRAGVLADMRSCIIIDDRKLFKLVTTNIEDFDSFLPDEKILKLYISKFDLKKLPNTMHPKVFSEMIKVSLDPITKTEENSASEEFKLDSVMARLKSGRFQKQCASLLNMQFDNIASRQMYSPFISPITDEERLAPLHKVNLQPVKKLLLRCAIKDDFSQAERSFTFQEEIFADNERFPRNYVFEFSIDEQKNESVLKKLLREILFNICLIYPLESKHIDLVYDLLFKSSTESEEKIRFLEESLQDLSIDIEDEKQKALHKLGTTIPYNLHAIIEYDLFRTFRMEEFVALKVSPTDVEDIFHYAQFLGEDSPADFSTDPITMAKLKIKTKHRGQVEIIDGSRVYGFKEKPDKQKPVKKESKPDDEIDEDLKKIAQIIWNAGQNCTDTESLRKNLDEISTRMIESVMHKYQNADEQLALQNSLNRMIALEIDKAIQKQTQELDPTQPQRENHPQQYSQCQKIIEGYFMQHFHRMRNEIEAYENFHQARNSRPYSSGGFQRRQQSSSCHNIESLIGSASTNAGPHPGLAQLWLKQANEDLQALNKAATSEVFNSWSFDMAVKVIENCLVALLMMHDYSLAPHFTSKLDKKENYSDVFEWISSQLISYLDSETKASVDRIMGDDLPLIMSRHNKLHRPDTVELKTSRCAIPVEVTSEMVEKCRQMFTVAQKMVVNQR